jgi:proline iminopeptidase
MSKISPNYTVSKEGFLDVEGGKVWYRIDGNSEGVPVITLHGGPGGAHIGMEPLASALAPERPVLLYDQLGCGASDRPEDTSLWTTERFVRELASLREQLGLTEVHLLGHSWGTMLLADYLLTEPKGVKSAIFSSPCLSATRWIQDADTYRLQLPSEVQEVLRACEANGTTDSDEYRAAEEVYTRRHVCRIERTPEQKARRKAAFGEGVYNTMWGPSEFHATGNLKDYDRTHQLHKLTVPALFTCGAYDEASPASTKYYHSLLPGSAFHIFENSAHSPIVEEPEAYFSVMRNFLNTVECR